MYDPENAIRITEVFNSIQQRIRAFTDKLSSIHPSDQAEELGDKLSECIENIRQGVEDCNNEFDPDKREDLCKLWRGKIDEFVNILKLMADNL